MERSMWSPLSRVYAQYHSSLNEAKSDYESRLKKWGMLLSREWEVCIRDNVYSFLRKFSDKDFRATQLRTWVERFFGTLEVPFVAIDGSSHIERGDRFISIYGGAYGSRGTVTVTAGGGKLIYRRWEMSRDVSMVAFIPIPPEAGGAIVDDLSAGELPREAKVLSDREIAEFTSMHNRVMQLAEVYLAHSLVSVGSQESPRLILMDTTLSGWLGNTSFGPDFLSVIGGKVCGVKVGKEEVYTALAHPLNKSLGVPAPSKFLPHYRLIAECHWHDATELEESRLPESVRGDVFRKGARALERLGLAEYDRGAKRLNLLFDPRESWERAVRAFEKLCRRLYREKSPKGLIYTPSDGGEAYLTPRDVQFFSGVGLRALIERCWSPDWRVLLVGVVKDSHSKYFIRNYLGSLHALRGEGSQLHTSAQLSDRTALELLAQIIDELEAPWSTLEFDSAFMTLWPKRDEKSGEWKVGGYESGRLGEYTRPPRLFLRSLAQFLLKPRTKLASHVIFIDRLAFPGWDDRDSEDVTVGSPDSGIGQLKVLRYTSPSRLHFVTMFLLTVLVRNHFPNAVGYPEPLYKADWGATSMRDQIKELLRSSWIVENSDPLHKTFRRVRDSLRR